MSIKKQYLKSGSLCKVTFSLPSEIAKVVSTAHLVGDFNDWDASVTPMKKLKNGTFTATITLKPNQEYQFRYFLDGKSWENDWNADKYIPNAFGSENSVVVV
jgi:1,4-alpha-glucan branching enzyme